jgi:catechol 2,3-dioxygenase-like lactoylglutathione lyase family enzyme
MSFAVQGIDHVEVFVRDLDAAARWYADVLGLELMGRWDPEPWMIGAGGNKLALFLKADGSRASDDAGWHRVAWRTDRAGFDAAQKHLREKGVKFRGPVDHGSAFSIYFTDPDGNRLEITHYI